MSKPFLSPSISFAALSACFFVVGSIRNAGLSLYTQTFIIKLI